MRDQTFANIWNHACEGAWSIGKSKMSVIELTKDNFNETVDNNDIVIVDFWAEWCGPCKSFAPIFEKVAENHPEIVFGKIDTEEQTELAQAFQIRSIPTLMLFREQIQLLAQPGALSIAQLEDLVQKVSELDMQPIHEQIRQRSAS